VQSVQIAYTADYYSHTADHYSHTHTADHYSHTTDLRLLLSHEFIKMNQSRISLAFCYRQRSLMSAQILQKTFQSE